MTNIKLGEPTRETILAQNAQAIRALGKRAISDIIEIGRLLTEAKQIAGHGNWLPWLEREFGWTDKTAENFLNVHKLGAQTKFENISDLNLPVSGLYLLAAPSTPVEARAAVFACAQNGERLSVKDVRNQIDEERKKHAPADRQPTRKSAIKKHPPALRSRAETPLTAEQAVHKLRDQIDAAVATAIGVSPMQPIIDAIFDIAATRAERNGNVKMFVQRVRQRIDAMDKVDQGLGAGCAPKIDLRAAR
ncbi:Protein of unknown function [Bradyrhizobium erythrophlei]|nr:Protein of unknown function [Bradyrhizobium erythrophlei]